MTQTDTTIATLEPRAVTEQVPQGIERTMLAQDRLPVALAVVLLVWAGILLLLVRTGRRLGQIERTLDALDDREPRTPSSV